MKTARISWCIALLGALASPACSHKPSTAPELHSLSGHVRLTGNLVDSTGGYVGTRVLDDVDGVPVDLLYGNRVVGRAFTVKGIYRFSGLGPGGYKARTRVIGTIGDDTDLLTIARADVPVGDTLKVESLGDIYPVPNPIGAATDLYFEIPDTEYVEVRILDMGGNLVRTLLAGELLPGLKVLNWSGINVQDHPATQPFYWATLVAGTDVRAQLLFK